MLNMDGLTEEETWLELRDRMGRLWCKYNPAAEVLEFRRGDVCVRFELAVYRAQAVREVDGRQQGTSVLSWAAEGCRPLRGG